MSKYLNDSLNKYIYHQHSIKYMCIPFSTFCFVFYAVYLQHLSEKFKIHIFVETIIMNAIYVQSFYSYSIFCFDSIGIKNRYSNSLSLNTNSHVCFPV